MSTIRIIDAYRDDGFQQLWLAIAGDNGAKSNRYTRTATDAYRQTWNTNDTNDANTNGG